MFVTFGTLRVNVFHKSRYCFVPFFMLIVLTNYKTTCSIKIQIASFKAVVSRSDRALERLRRFHFVINHCFVFRFQNDCHLRYSRAEAGATGTLTTAFRDWFLRR